MKKRPQALQSALNLNGLETALELIEFGHEAAMILPGVGRAVWRQALADVEQSEQSTSEHERFFNFVAANSTDENF